MTVTDPRPEASTTDLLREAIDETRRLVELEVALAKDEVREELVGARRSAIMFGVAAVAAVLALAMLLCALALAIFPGPAPALVLGLSLSLAAAGFGWFAWRAAPKSPLVRTRRRVESDARVLREGLS